MQTIKTIQPGLPKGGGAIQGLGETFKGSDFTGTASLSIPVPATPCRDLTPNLSIEYNSGAGNSVFGIGFDLSLPEIARQTSKGTPRYTDDDTFLHTGSDYLVPKQGKETETRALNGASYTVTTYIPRTEGDFDLIERWVAPDKESFWKVTTRENLTHIFGYMPSARITDPADNTRIFKWLIQETYDSRGNHILYNWEGENPADIADAIYEQKRTHTTQKYITHVKYGNFSPLPESILLTQPSPAVQWHFEVVFDYGQYDLTSAYPYTPQPGAKPLYRSDPFSGYHAGFEVRTHRLCRNIMLFHCFDPKEYGTDTPVLTRSLSLAYRETGTLSFLEEVRETGYSYNNGAYDSKSLAPLTFGYSDFQPDQQSFRVLEEQDGRSFIGVNAYPYQLVDLYGEGIPGILYSEGASILYRRPLGVRENPEASAPGYDDLEEVLSFPIDRQTSGDAYMLADVTGNGRLDLMASMPQQAGFYAQKPDCTWEPFYPFAEFPADFHHPGMRMADITGRGLADLIIIDREEVRVYPDERAGGFANTIIQQREKDLPYAISGSPEIVLRFADMAGAGTPQLARIKDGCVEYWPSLGYGRFGPRVTMEKAPCFGEDFDTSRLFLADTDGSGTADLVYVCKDRIRLYLNRSGNSFAEPVDIILPSAWDNLDQVMVSDIYGTGTVSIIFSKLHPEPGHWCCDLCNRHKPYLLISASNNMGARTEITYASSVKFYLEDKEKGEPWITRLPFPVHVMEKVRHIDEISGNTLVSVYRYKHGYYDGIEREYRGFGYVERQDAESFTGLQTEPDGSPSPYELPPLLHKTWYHTGASLEEQSLLLQYKKEYFNGDPGALALPDTAFEPLPGDTDKGSLREAYRSLRGMALREESYGADMSPWQGIPYAVTETRCRSKELQARGSNKYSVWMPDVMESVTYNYERNAGDPRVAHEFILERDEYGHVLNSAQVFYGRRAGNGDNLDDQTKTQQKKTGILLHNNLWINNVTDFYLLGAPLESSSYEIAGLQPGQGDYFTFDELYNKLIQETADVTKTLREWHRHYYYDADNRAELPHGQVTARDLLHRTESAEFDIQSLASCFQGIMDGAGLEARLISVEPDGGGYVSFTGGDPGAQYYWNPGVRQEYNNRDGFYLPAAFIDSFGNRLQYKYDEYSLVVTKVSDALDNTTEITMMNYLHLAPVAINDINGNTQEVILDPLGLVYASTFYGSEGGTRVGFDSLYPASPIPPEPQSPEDIIENPGKYLNNAFHYFYYNPLSWAQDKIPAYALSLIAEDYPGTDARIRVQIQYNDGFGRVVQDKLKVPEASEGFWQTGAGGKDEKVSADHIWLTSGAVRYNNKGHVVREYEPFFKGEYTFTDQEQLGVSHALYYDPMDRLVLTIDPRGFMTKTLFGALTAGSPIDTSQGGFLMKELYAGLSGGFQPSAWAEADFDENNTATETAYYANRQSLPEWEKAGVEKAAAFQNLPEVKLTDNQGHEVQTYRTGVTGSSNYFCYDILGYLQWSADDRLSGAGKKNFEYTYSMTGAAIKTVSADAGSHWHVSNTLGNIIYSHDLRNFDFNYRYDPLHRLSQKQVSGGDGAPLPLTTVEYYVYGDSKKDGSAIFADPAKWNNRGQLVTIFDQAGLVLSSYHTIQDIPLAHARLLWAAYETESDWGIIESGGGLAELATLLLNQPDCPAFDQTYILNSLSTIKENLLPEAFITRFAYDALNRDTQITHADAHKFAYQYYSTGALQLIDTDDGEPQAPQVKEFTYNARGQRRTILYGNDMESNFKYDPLLFRLTGISSQNAGRDITYQDIVYYYDAAGNITHLTDAAPLSFLQGDLCPEHDYTYNALYQLERASGREYSDMWEEVQLNRDNPGTKFITFDEGSPGVQPYVQDFQYDDSNNLLRLTHTAGATALELDQTIEGSSNRLVSGRLSVSPSGPEIQNYQYDYDNNGNQANLDGAVDVAWDYSNELRRIEQPGSIYEYYRYDNRGVRVRKIQVMGADTEETIYVGDLEVHRKNTGATVIEEWHALRMRDGHLCTAEWRYWLTLPPSGCLPAAQVSYQMTNHLDSAVVEVDAGGDILSYQEYYPYGGTALLAGKSSDDMEMKRHRYSGEEQDKSTGLYYYGARYYPVWQARWINPDPAGTVDGLNLYAFVGGEPVRWRDLNGMSRSPRGGHVPATEGRQRESALFWAKFSPNPTPGIAKTPVHAKAQANHPPVDVGGMVKSFIGRPKDVPGKNTNSINRDQSRSRSPRRHDQEGRDRSRSTSPSGKHPDKKYQNKAMMCIVTNNCTGMIYIGYSGTAGGMAKGNSIIDNEQSHRRYDRIKGTMETVKHLELRRPENCAEAAAYSIAVSYGEVLKNLSFRAIGTDGQEVPQCRNCQQWVPNQKEAGVGGGRGAAAGKDGRGRSSARRGRRADAREGTDLAGKGTTKQDRDA
jgi:RHS repeat-associated protein